MSIILGHEADSLAPLSGISFLDRDLYGNAYGDEVRGILRIRNAR